MQARTVGFSASFLLCVALGVGYDSLPGGLREFAPIFILLVVVAFVVSRLPRIEVGHDDRFRRRRLTNWLPLGLTYAFLYMGRYNLKISKFAFESMPAPDGGAMMGNDDFGWIFLVGTVTYGLSFVINGPLTDRYGGRFSMLVGTAGAALMNLCMGLASWSLLAEGPLHGAIARSFTPLFCALYGLNMYFQSFGAVAIVKVNAPWFHVRERGVFGAIFGILISLGIYFAYGWGDLILAHLGLVWVFFVPSILLGVFWCLDAWIVRDSPGEAGLADFDTQDASSGDDGPRLPVRRVFAMMLRNPIIVTIAGIEFCSGFLRQAIMQWYRTFAKQTDAVLGFKGGDFIYENWGVLLCCAGILGGVVAGVISDHVFRSRRGPVAAVLYGVMLAGALMLTLGYQTSLAGPLVLVMSMAVIGVHGMLSGTASMDFGGRRNVGVAVGLIDGFVYLGTGVMSLTYALALPREEFDADGNLIGPVLDPDNWIAWPVAMIPMALIGLLLAVRVWHARPTAHKT
jgi:OPA family glycerol-3-phosphate transporter-like MFS transporter